MKIIENDIKTRAIKEAKYMLKNKSNIRECAKFFNVSKSTVHLDVSKRLEKFDLKLFVKIKKLLNVNFAQKHIRGGLSTKNKYLKFSK